MAIRGGRGESPKIKMALRQAEGEGDVGDAGTTAEHGTEGQTKWAA